MPQLHSRNEFMVRQNLEQPEIFGSYFWRPGCHHIFSIPNFNSNRDRWIFSTYITFLGVEDWVNNWKWLDSSIYDPLQWRCGVYTYGCSFSCTTLSFVWYQCVYVFYSSTTILFPSARIYFPCVQKNYWNDFWKQTPITTSKWWCWKRIMNKSRHV